MASSRRIERVNSLLKEVISEVIRRDIKVPHMPDLITITEVDTSKDIRHAKVYVSLIENDENRRRLTLELLQEQAPNISRIASKKVVLRYFPVLQFYIDESAEQYMKIDTLLKEVNTAPQEDDDPTTT